MATALDRPTVVVVDEMRWACFDQMAGALRRRGVRTVRLTRDDDTFARVIDRLVYDEARAFRDDAELARLLQAYDTPQLADVLAIDDLVPVVASVPWRAAPERTKRRLRDRGAWVDKVTASQRLAAAGVPVPAVRLASQTSPDEAVAALGLPLVVKTRIGAGGAGVRVVESAEQARAALVELGGDPEQIYYEGFARGADLCVGLAFDGDRVFDEAGYESHRDPGDDLGPSARIVVRDDPRALAVGRAVARAVGGSGVVNLDLLDGPEGPQVVDVNLRVWGSALILTEAGCRVDLGYLEALTGAAGDDEAPTGAAGGDAPPRTARPGGPFTAFPDEVIQRTLGDGRFDLRRILAPGRPFLVSAGPRYVLSAVLFAARIWGLQARLGDSAILRPLRSVLRALRR